MEPLRQNNFLQSSPQRKATPITITLCTLAPVQSKTFDVITPTRQEFVVAQ